MILKTSYSVDNSYISESVNHLHNFGFKTSINKPTGRFFYDHWIIKDEFKDTVWDRILKTLPVNIGEARIIILEPATCYQIHADIDDRYHLNLQSENCYMIDISNNHIHEINLDGIWFEMNTSFLHSAVNFGRYQRIQLVVRKLLNDNKLNNPRTVKITTDVLSPDNRRFIFDQTLSPWLNLANKSGIISNFKFSTEVVEFDIESSEIENLKKHTVKEFNLKLD